MEGHLSLRPPIPQEVMNKVAIPTTTINFAIFMINNIYCKINDFEANFNALSKINSSKLPSIALNIGELRKKFGEVAPLAAEQLKLHDKGWKKLPAFMEAGCLLDQRAFEQCTAQTVALWKAHYLKANSVLSLTGGLGVDDWAFSQSGATVVSTDTNHNLNHLVRYNFKLLKCSIERLDLEAELLLQSNEYQNFEWIYVDPDRRAGHDRLGGNVSAYSPNILALIPQYQEQFPKWLIKLSPMVEYSSLTNLPGQKIFIAVVYQGETKELLLQLNTQTPNEVFRRVVNLDVLPVVEYWHEIPNTIPQNGTNHIFEPNPGFFCLKLHRELIDFEGFEPLTPQRGFYQVKGLPPKHWGRTFELCAQLEGGLNVIQRELKAMGYTEMSITARECGLPTEDIKKALGFKESQEFCLFMTRKNKKFCAWLGKRIIY